MEHLVGEIRAYAWGSTDAIPAILGTPRTGEPQAEYWLGAHQSAPSHLGGTPLDAILASHPEWIGERSRERFGDVLPYLMKILAADQPLSLQAHPSRAQAEEGFTRENAAGIALDDPQRTYKDAWPKPEIIVALTPFDGLCGFADPHRTWELFEQLKASDDVMELVAPLKGRCGEAGLAEVFLEVLSMGPDRQNIVTEVVAAAVRQRNAHGPLGRFARTAIELDEFYPGDPSIIAALLCNRVTLQPGEALFMPAANMHAYLKGTGIEVMANSDNVLRGGLTPKYIDVAQLVEVVNFAPETPSVIYSVGVAPGLSRYPTPAPEFALWRLDLADGIEVALPASDSARVLLVIEGFLTTDDPACTELHQGESAFLPAGEHRSVKGNCVAFLAAPGV